MVDKVYRRIGFVAAILTLFLIFPSYTQATALWVSSYPSKNPSETPKVICVSRKNNNFVYAATQDSSSNFSLLRSEDKGLTWKDLKPSLPTGGDINWVSVSASDSGVVAISIWSSGVFMSFDKGENWNKIFDSIRPRAVEFSPLDQNTLFVGIGGNLSSSGVYRTTNGGLHWTKMDALGVHNNSQIVIDYKNPGTVFADADPSFFKSTDNGGSWSMVPLYHVYSNSVIDRLIPDTIYSSQYDSNIGLYKSTDGGTSWQLKSVGLGSALYRLGQDDSGIILGSRIGQPGIPPGGVWESKDRAEHWENIADPVWGNRNTWGLDVGGGRVFVGVEGLGIFYSDVSISPPPPNHVIFVPGFGGSWSYKGLIENQPTTYADWSLTPYFTDGFYQPLITTLKNAGVEPLIFAYDFRKSVANSAASLNTYLTDKIPTGKANVVAHSMGGLVVRYCFEKVPGCADKIDKIVTAGSPYQGTLKAYPLWESGDFGNLDLPTKTAVEIALRSNSFPYLTDKDIIQNKFPGVRDLLPVSNPPGVSISDNFTAFSGTNTPTWSGFTTIARSSLDKALGLWLDGKPGVYSTDDGDDTVLKTSSQLGAKTNYYSLRHGDYFQNATSLSDLLTLFGLSTNNLVTSVNKPSSVLAFIVHSPVTLSVAGQTGKAIFISNPTTQNYQITLTGTGNGSYQLDSFFVKDNLVVNKTFNGSITNNATQTVNFNFSPDPGQNFNDNDASQLLSSVRQKIGQSNIRNLKIIDVTVAQAFNDIRLNRNRTSAFSNLEKSLVDVWKLLAAENKAENRQEITQVANQLISLTVRLNQLYRQEISVTNANTEIARSQKSLDTKAALPSLSIRDAANLNLATKNLSSARELVSVGKNYQGLLLARSILSLVN